MEVGMLTFLNKLSLKQSLVVIIQNKYQKCKLWNNSFKILKKAFVVVFKGEIHK